MRPWSTTLPLRVAAARRGPVSVRVLVLNDYPSGRPLAVASAQLLIAVTPATATAPFYPPARPAGERRVLAAATHTVQMADLAYWRTGKLHGLILSLLKST
jgi:hypothetical protein